MPAPRDWDEHFAQATHIFVFRLVSAEVQEHEALSNRLQTVIGRIRWLENLRGDGSQFGEIAFNTDPCGGTRLEIGHYFLAVTNADGYRIEGSYDNLIDITEEYREGENNHALGWFLSALGPAIAGEVLLSDVLHPRFRYNTHTSPPPPPPPRPEAVADKP